MIDLAALAKLERAASPRLWRVHTNPRKWIELPIDGDPNVDPNRDNNAVFVAEMRNALPELIAELRRLRILLAQGAHWFAHDGQTERETVPCSPDCYRCAIDREFVTESPESDTLP